MHSLAIFGNPIGHSLSPQIHTQFGKQEQINLEYKKHLILLNEFENQVFHFFAGGGKGLNITVPFKERAFAIAENLSDRAKLAESVNTLKIDDCGLLYGDNTDGAGLLRDLTHNVGLNLKNKKVLLLGAGGAARGVIAPLLAQEIEMLWIANRTLEKAEYLAEHFNSLGSIQSSSLDQLSGQTFDLIINSTSQGLHGEEFKLDASILTPETFCYDMVYGQADTPFMIWAKQAGAKQIHSGMGMLIEQAAEAFYVWFGVRPETHNIFLLTKN